MKEVKPNVKEDFRLAKKVMMNSNPTLLSAGKYEIYRPYFASTQNLNYISDLTKKMDIKSAFTILGSGEPVFELISQDVDNIIATDTNPFTKYIYYLKKAAIKTLSNKEYISFILDPYNNNFLSKKLISEKVSSGFSKKEKDYLEFWDKILNYDSRELLIYGFFRPAFRYTKAEDRKLYSTYIHTKKYNQLKEKIDSVNIKIYQEEAKELLDNLDESFDYIDITNILLFVVQQYDIDSKDFDTYMKDLKAIISKRLNDNGIFIIDYMFKTHNPKQYLIDRTTKTNDLMSRINDIYSIIYRTVNEYFDVQAVKYKAIPSTINNPVENKMPDQVVYTKKI